jgi:hypothetical protein
MRLLAEKIVAEWERERRLEKSAPAQQNVPHETSDSRQLQSV